MVNVKSEFLIITQLLSISFILAKYLIDEESLIHNPVSKRISNTPKSMKIKIFLNLDRQAGKHTMFRMYFQLKFQQNYYTLGKFLRFGILRWFSSYN